MMIIAVTLLLFLAPLAGWLLTWQLVEYIWQEQEWTELARVSDWEAWKHHYYERTGELWTTWHQLPAITMGGSTYGRATPTEETH